MNTRLVNLKSAADSMHPTLVAARPQRGGGRPGARPALAQQGGGLTMEQIQQSLGNAYGTRQVSTIYGQNDQYPVLLELLPQFQRPMRSGVWMLTVVVRSSAKSDTVSRGVAPPGRPGTSSVPAPV